MKSFNFNIDRGLGIQKKEKDIFTKYKEDGKIKLINKLFKEKIVPLNHFDQSDYSLIMIIKKWFLHTEK